MKKEEPGFEKDYESVLNAGVIRGGIMVSDYSG
jgi:hypothetical protein